MARNDDEKRWYAFRHPNQDAKLFGLGTEKEAIDYLKYLTRTGHAYEMCIPSQPLFFPPGSCKFNIGVTLEGVKIQHDRAGAMS